MSLIQKVVDLIEECGPATLDDIEIQCGGATRQQIIKAMQNADQLGLIERVGDAPRVPGVRGRPLGIYACTGEAPCRADAQRPLPPRGQLGHLGRISSVFELGATA